MPAKRAIRDSEDEGHHELAPNEEALPKKNGKASVKAAEPESDEEDNPFEEEVFEVEAIRGRKRKNKKIVFLVRWKGYDSADDTWEPEENLQDALEILDEWKRANNVKDDDPPSEPPKKAKGRVSTASTASTRAKRAAPKSTTSDDAPVLERRKGGAAGAKKRKTGKEAETVKKQAVPERDTEEDLERAFAGSPEPDELPENDWDKKYAKESSWEAYVQRVITIEKAQQSVQVLIQWTDNSTKWITNALAREKFPQMMLNFYETHLTFQAQDEEETEQDGVNGV